LLNFFFNIELVENSALTSPTCFFPIFFHLFFPKLSSSSFFNFFVFFFQIFFCWFYFFHMELVGNLAL
jgi:hypothetical protein